MSVVGDLLKDANPFSAVLDAANTLIDRLVPDKNAAEKAKAELAQRAQEIQADADKDQRDINKVEAASSNLFVAGWRPAAGWTCVAALFCYYVPYILAATVLWVIQVVKTGSLMPRPDLGIADLVALLGSLLGIGTLRSADKFNGVATTAVQFFKPKK